MRVAEIVHKPNAAPGAIPGAAFRFSRGTADLADADRADVVVGAAEVPHAARDHDAAAVEIGALAHQGLRIAADLDRADRVGPAAEASQPLSRAGAAAVAAEVGVLVEADAIAAAAGPAGPDVEAAGTDLEAEA